MLQRTKVEKLTGGYLAAGSPRKSPLAITGGRDCLSPDELALLLEFFGLLAAWDGDGTHAH